MFSMEAGLYGCRIVQLLTAYYSNRLMESQYNSLSLNTLLYFPLFESVLRACDLNSEC